MGVKKKVIYIVIRYATVQVGETRGERAPGKKAEGEAREQTEALSMIKQRGQEERRSWGSRARRKFGGGGGQGILPSTKRNNIAGGKKGKNHLSNWPSARLSR